jgi:hypothetical protein
MKVFGMIEIIWVLFLTAVYLFCVVVLGFFVLLFGKD